MCLYSLYSNFYSTFGMNNPVPYPLVIVKLSSSLLPFFTLVIQHRSRISFSQLSSIFVHFAKIYLLCNKFEGPASNYAIS